MEKAEGRTKERGHEGILEVRTATQGRNREERGNHCV